VIERVRETGVWLALLILSFVWIVATLHRGEPLAWDELEFFRATRWVAEGKLPYRDYWEHHMPLQWLLFAPVAGLFGDGNGASGLLSVRWAQLPLWIAALALMTTIARREGLDRWARWAALVLLLAAPSFVRGALQYRVDVLGNLAFVAALAVIVIRSARASWIAFGALMSIAVLANMRLAPLVIVAGAIALLWRVEDRKWGWNPQALWMGAGVTAMAAAFILYLAATRSWPAFVDGVIEYNIVSDRLVPSDAGSFLQRLFAPLLERDVAAIVYWACGVTGLVLALRNVARPGPLQIIAILVIASLAAVAATAVQYPYHFQTASVLLLPLAAAALAHLLPKWRFVPAFAAAIALAVNLIPLTREGYGNAIRDQDRVMRAVHQVTSEEETVWDSAGYAVHRDPAYRYWFLPAGVRLMAQAKLIEPYDLPQLSARPPGAIVYNLRIHYWMLTFPRLAAYVYRHYVPLHRNLWIPGLSTAIGPDGPTVRRWIVPKSGRYAIWSSEFLAYHPWFARPLDYGLIEGEGAAELEIPLRRLPPLPPDALQWRVDGAPVAPGTITLDLRAGSRLELSGMTARPAGVFVVPAGVETLCTAPPERFVF
jgi:hypothetical protein